MLKYCPLTKSFLLAPQDKGYFVLNYMFRYMDKPKHNEVSTEDVVVVGPVILEQETIVIPENNIIEEEAPDSDVTEEPRLEYNILESI